MPTPRKSVSKRTIPKAWPLSKRFWIDAAALIFRFAFDPDFASDLMPAYHAFEYLRLVVFHLVGVGGRAEPTSSDHRTRGSPGCRPRCVVLRGA